MKLRSLIIVPAFLFLAAFPLSCSVSSADGGVFKSVDKAENWQSKNKIDEKKNISRLDALNLTIDPSDSQTIYLGTRGSGLYKSENGGESWSKIIDQSGKLSGAATIRDVAIDPRDPDRLYVSTYQNNRGRFFRTENGGVNWEQTYVTDKEEYAIYAAAIDPNNSKLIYMGTGQGGFLRSSDYGKSWESIYWLEDLVTDIIIDPNNSATIYISTSKKGILKSTNWGNNWTSFSSQLKKFQSAQSLQSLFIDSKNPNIIYSGSRYGLLRSRNSGADWEEVNIIIPPKSSLILSVAVNPQDSNNIYYSVGAIIYRSLDGGTNWTVYQIPSKRNIKAIVIDPDQAETIYIGLSQ